MTQPGSTIHLRKITHGVLGAIVALGTAGGLVLGTTTAANAAPFTPTYPTVYIAQGSPTQLSAAVQQAGGVAFEAVGLPPGPQYNAIGFRDSDKYIYGFTNGSAPGSAGELVRVHDDGHVDNLGTPVGIPADAGINAGTFLGDDFYTYVSNSSGGGSASIYRVDVSVPSAVSIALTGPKVKAQDITSAQGYLWGIQFNESSIIRIDPVTGVSTTFAVPAVPAGSYGAAWTYGNGNLAFSNNSSGTIYQLAITDAGTASPTIEVVSTVPGPPNVQNDGTSSPALPVDLALTKSVVPAGARAGATVTYTLTVSNAGPGGSSGYSVSDPLPAGLTNPTSSGCTFAGGTATCVGGRLDVDESASFVITATLAAPFTAPIRNEASVLGNEQDPNPDNDTDDAVVTPLLPPVATDDTRSTPYNTPVDLPATANDTPGQPGTPLDPSLTVFTDPDATNAGKTLETDEGVWQVNANGTVTFTPTPGFTGTTPAVEYRITDSAGGTDTADLVVTVRPGPTAAPDTETTKQNVDVTLDPLTNDTPGLLTGGGAGSWVKTSVVFPSGPGTPGTVSNGGKTLTVPDQGVYTINPTTGVVTFDPAPAFTGVATSVPYEVTDSNGNPARSTITITVTPIVPVANDDTASTPFNTPVTLPAVTDDEPGDPSAPLVPTATVFTDPDATNGGKTLETDEGVWQVNPTGTVTFTPAPGFTGLTPPVEYRISDANGTTDVALLSVQVGAGPLAEPDVDSTPQNVNVTVDVVDNDTPGAGQTFVPTSVVFPPGPNGAGTVSDGGKTLTIPGEGVYTIDPNSGEVTFDPEPQFTGPATSVTYTVTDTADNDATSTLTITVAPIVPVANDDAATTPFNTPVTLPAVADDAAGASTAPLVPGATVFTSPAATNGGKTLVTPQGTWQVNPDGTATFTPAPGFTGTTPAVEYQIRDTNGSTDTALLTVTVRPGPIAQADTGTTPHDTVVTVPVLPNDTPSQLADGTPGSWVPSTVVFTSPAATNGGHTLVVPGEGVYTINPSTGAVTFDPEPGFTGQATPVGYQVSDTNGNKAQSTVTITVGPAATTPPPPAPEDEFDLVLTKRAVSGSQARVGETVRYRLTVTNRGPGKARGPLTLSDPLPQGLELVSATGKGWKCTARTATDRVSCVRKSSLRAKRSAAPVFVVAKATRAAVGRVLNVAKVRARGEGVRSNNKGRATITVVPAELPSTGFRPTLPGV